MNYGLLVVTDGRKECLMRAVDSFDESVAPRPRHRVIICDHEGGEFCDWIDKRFAGWHVIHGGRRGFGGTIQTAWAYVAALPGIEYIFHLEDDFTFNELLDLRPLAALLRGHPELVQVALLRQAVNPQEKEAGGLIALHPDWYLDREEDNASWMEHDAFFTTNPSLYRQSLCSLPWPDGADSEGHFGIGLREADPATRFAFWGRREHPPRVHHIGDERVGTGY